MKERLECILLVDDDLITNFLHTRLIKKLNITTSIAVRNNGEEALQYIQDNHAPDMNFLDLNMPVMNGFEFLKSFFHQYGNNVNTRIIVLSSSINMRDKTITSSYGIPFLTKPLLEDKLLEVL